jgi:Tfp pilus assembly protein PilF
MQSLAEAMGLALQYQRSGSLHQAEFLYGQILQTAPAHAEAARRLGNVYQAQGRLEEAIALYRRAVALKPEFGVALNDLGVVLAMTGRPEEAAVPLQEAGRILPDVPDPFNNLGIVLTTLGRLDEAVTTFHQALRIKPDYPEALNNLGKALQEQGRLEKAEETYRQALRLKSGYVNGHNNLGFVLKEQGRLDEALAGIAQALRLQPDSAEAHVNRAETWLLQGNFAQGWPEYEWRWRWREFKPRSFRQPRWDGAPLAGRTILLHAEQGVGDTLQFIRYAPLVRSRGGTVLVEAPAGLVPLLARCAGVDRVAAIGSGLPDFAVHAPLLSLPAVFGTTLASVPAEIPYLSADAQLVELWRNELAAVGGLRVGIVWQGRPSHKRDRHRSVPLTYFEPLARVSGVHLVSLQVGPGTEQVPTVASRFPLFDLGSRFDPASFMDAAAAVMSLDLVITVDTSMAHLAGALGVPVWVALPFAPDFRWLLHREDSPWYPSMRLFRQTAPGAWMEVFERLAGALNELLARSGAASWK